MTRNSSIDLLRGLGMLLVVLAHVGPPAWLAQLRNFDVPLLMLVAGLAHAQSRSARPYLQQLRARCERLLLPSWLFLIAYFTAWALLRPETLPAFEGLRDSFLMSGGIGYLWIFKVMLGVALLTPVLVRWARRETSTARWLTGWLAALIGVDALRQLLLPGARLLDPSLFLLLPYALLFTLGLRLQALPPRAVRLLALGAAGVCALLAWVHQARHGEWQFTQLAKYPPQLYYLSYALALSLLLWDRIAWLHRAVDALRLRRPLDFLSRNSVWVYLWHIALLQVAPGPWGMRFVAVLGGAMLICALQLTLVERWLLPLLRSRPVAQQWMQRVLVG